MFWLTVTVNCNAVYQSCPAASPPGQDVRFLQNAPGSEKRGTISQLLVSCAERRSGAHVDGIGCGRRSRAGPGLARGAPIVIIALLTTSKSTADNKIRALLTTRIVVKALLTTSKPATPTTNTVRRESRWSTRGRRRLRGTLPRRTSTGSLSPNRDPPPI